MQYGLIGKRLSHSYSVQIHKAIADYNYELLEIPENELCNFFKNRDFMGVNVTIPYKERVIPYLDEISDSARRIGAVNTVVNKNGKLFGYNTDFYGLKALILKNGIQLSGKKVAILGTGGTSKTASSVSQSLGAKEIIFVSRSQKPNAVTFSELSEKHKDTAIIINTTPVGMFPSDDESPLCLDSFSLLDGVIDVVYNPLRTNLVLDAQKKGIVSSGGLYMLCAQAVYACSLFTGKEADESIIDTAYNTIRQQKENIVLTGMPSSGKSTVAKILSDTLKRDFFDGDTEIIEKIKMPIRDFFQKYGEAEFRKIEKEIISDLSKKSGVIIATGGGAVLDSANVRALKRNGRIFFLNRSVQNLIPTEDRPLSVDFDALRQMFNRRYPIYKKTADTEISADYSPKDIANSILKEL